MRKVLGAALLLLTSGALAAPRMYVVGSGDCRDLDLQTNRRAFADELKRRLGPGLMDDESAKNLLSPEATSTVEDLQRRLDTARQQYYQAHYDKAEDAIEVTLREISRLPVGRERWNLTTSGELLLGLVYRSTKREKQADEAFRRVLRLDPSFQMDEDYYSPSTRVRFERVRRELSGARRVQLSVTSTPAGAEVYLDGRKVGTTPYQGEHLPGRYELTLAKNGERALPHAVTLTRETAVPIDFAFESSVHPQKLPCIARRSETELLAYAVSLGALLGVEEVAVVRFEQPEAGPGWLAATLMSSGSGGKIREGGLRVPRNSRTAAGLGELAEFVVTGKPSGNVEVNPKLPKVQPSLVPEPSPLTATNDAPPPASDLMQVQKQVPGKRTWKTPVGVGLIAAGLIGGGVAGGFLQKDADAKWRTYEAFYPDPNTGPSVSDAPAVKRAGAAYAEAQTKAIVAFGVGGAAAIAGAVLVIVDNVGGKGPDHTGITVSASPTSVNATLRFP